MRKMSPATALRLGRVSNLPTVWTNVAAGVALGGAAWSPAVVACLLLSGSLFYVGGMYLNDAFDAETDALERPERPIPSGLVDTRTVYATGFAMLLSAGGLALLAALFAGAALPRAALAALALTVAIVSYDAVHKDVAVAPLVMGACRALLYVACALATGGSLGRGVVIAAVALLLYVAGLTYLAARENLSELGNLWPLLMMATPAVAALGDGHSGIATLTAIAAFTAWTLRAVAFAARSQHRDVPGAVTRLIAGISLCDAIAVSSISAGAAALVVLGVPLTRLFQRSVPGT